MTRRIVCAVLDSAVQGFGQPFFVAATGQATRSFGDEINRKEQGNALAAHPDDYTLYQLGMFDEETGEFTNDKRVLARGKDLVQS